MATYDQELIGYMNLFEKLTRTELKDCFFFKDKIVFMVDKGNLGKALGKNKSNIVKLEKLLNRRFKIIEYHDDLLQFIQNLMAPLRCKEISEEDNIVIITGPDTKTKGLMIGARAQNLREYERLTQKYFPELREIKVV